MDLQSQDHLTWSDLPEIRKQFQPFARNDRTMEMLYSDGSFSSKSGIGGMAVIAPEWTAIYGGGTWCSMHDIFIGREPEYGAVAFFASCTCKGANDAEKNALNIAFRLAYDMISLADEEQNVDMKVEIVTDSTFNIDWVTRWNTIGDPILNSIYGLWSERRIILSRVNGHNGNFGNELADKWAGKARRFGESHTPRALKPQGDVLSRSQRRKRRNTPPTSRLRHFYSWCGNDGVPASTTSGSTLNSQSTKWLRYNGNPPGQKERSIMNQTDHLSNQVL